VQVSVAEDVYAALKVEAEKQGKSESHLASEALRQYLKL
jgi:hypothetical protein